MQASQESVPLSPQTLEASLKTVLNAFIVLVETEAQTLLKDRSALHHAGHSYGTLGKSKPFRRHRKGICHKGENYIAHNYTLGIGVENATDFVGVSRATLYRAFMEYEGLSPAQYITDFRVNAACRLLEETELPVSAVARSVGYNDSLYFSRIFHKTKGVSPTEYRADALCTKGENKAFSVDKGI